MEVVGAVASFIAIGQVLASGRRVIDVLRRIPGIGDELAWLNNEIETLRLVVEEADMRGTSTDRSLPETPLLRRARLQLGEVVSDLEQLHRDCARAAGEDGKVKAKKAKWFFQQKRLSECREKARDARANLFAALHTLQLKETRETKQHLLRVESFTIETHGAMALMSSSPKDLYGSSRDEQQPRVRHVEGLRRPHHAKSIDQLTPDLEKLVLSRNRSPKSNRRRPTPRGSDSIIINASLSALDKCPQPCGCRCHSSSPASYKSADWAKTLIGSVSLSYKQQLDRGGGAKCDSKTCAGSRKASAHFSYCFPAWLCSRLLSLQASWAASGEINISLRPIRVLSSGDSFWGCVEQWSISEVRQVMDHKGVIYPGDLGPNEETALQHVIRHGTTDIVMYLARFWGEHLYSGSFDDTWFFQANRLLEDSSMPSERKYALSSMVSRTEDEIDAQETPLHSAVRRADFGEMQQAAKSQPWTMSQLDYCGKTPLHVAASLGNVDAARELLKAGCNVNQRDAVGDTALMTALKTGHVVLAQFLIDTGCMVDAQSKAGVAALHCASHLSTGTALTDAMGSLLSAGATPTIANVDGVTVLHTLIWSDADKDTFKAGLRMLLSAGVDLEARDCLGRTALADAVEWDRPVALECFVEAGANAATVRPHGNILHSAAGSAGYEVLSYLESLSLSGINLDHINEDGNTVWDSFIWVSYAEDWRIANCRRPSPEEEQAFVRVYRGVRDRSLASDVKTLQRVREHAAHKDRRAATAALAPLIKQKEEWGRGDLAETYKTIRLQIREGMWDAAVESVDENVGLLQEEMATSPWEKPSRHDSLRYEDSDETAIESEYELETTTVHSTGDEEEATEIEGDEEEEEEEEEEE